jgi:5-bromo-4-chloroindolyl phosphate hydrolysis protein
MGMGLDTSKKAPVQKSIPVTGIESVDQLVRHGQEMIAQIRDENSQIPDPELSKKIDELESISNQIFLTVTDKPEKAPQIRRFMDYYLPTVLKMLTNYRKLGEREVTGENAEKTKKSVEDAMDIVLEAFTKQHDQLYQRDMLDVTTDISVLETLMKQDGLIENVPMKPEEKQAGQSQAAGGQ